MIDKIDQKRIGIFLGFAFGISWVTGLIIYLTGGLENSPVYTVAGGQISLALILLATAYMFGPAIANLLTRILTNEGNFGENLRLNFEGGRWLYWLAAWFLPAILTIIGGALYFLIFPAHFDSNLTFLLEQLSTVGMTDVNPWMIVALQTLQGILIAPLLNALPVFGEEFGWRGYLQPKLMPLGGRKAVLLVGVIWGIWHWPVILMGYNYGHDYFGAPLLGPVAMVIFTVSVSIFFGWVTIKSSGVYPAVVGHGALNGIAALSLIFVRGNPETLLGPTPVGLIGGLGFILLAVLLYFHPNALNSDVPPNQTP